MKLTPEQLRALIDGLGKNDFTRAVHIKGAPENGEEQTAYNPLKGNILKLMYDNLPDLGINRYLHYYSKDHPINLLMDADASYISSAAMEILQSEEKTKFAVDEYLNLFAPTINHAFDLFCKAHNKTKEELSDAEIDYVSASARDVIVKTLLDVLMQGQQFSDINKIAHIAPTHEDFAGSINQDAINFRDRWTHCKTAVGTMLSLDSDSLDDPIYEDDHLTLIMCKDFCATLQDTDAAIFHLKQKGCSNIEIAKQLGYQNHSAVSKRLSRIRKKWEEFMNASE